MRCLVLVALLVLALAPLPASAQSIALSPVLTGLDRPIGITHAGDGSGRLFIVLQGGKILVYDRASTSEFLDISTLVLCCGEQGLLGLAFHPNYADNGFFYVNYVNTSNQTVIARYSVSANPDVANPGSAFPILTIDQPFSNHKGGQIKFGPDGYLYTATGDGGSAGDPDNRAQNLGLLLGKLLRLDVDGGSPYATPADNPFVNTQGARREIWAYGLRNPWRFSFDRETGDLFTADVGQSSREEVNFQTATSGGGQNYGWRLMEGSFCYNPSSGCNDGTLTLPVLEYGHSLGCSITGGYRYRGIQYPQLVGTYFYGDFCSGRIWGSTTASGPGPWPTSVLLDTELSISTFGEDEAGEIYVAHMHATDGVIYRIVPLGGDNVIDNISPDTRFTGSWCLSTAPNAFDAYSLYSCGAGVDTYRWTPIIPAQATYSVYVWWTSHANRSRDVPISVIHAGGTTTRTFDQRVGGGQWVLHGQYPFAQGTSGYVEVIDSAGQAAADAVKLVPIGELIIDNGQTGTSSTGTWCVSTATSFFGSNSLYSCGNGTDTYRWTPSIPTAGLYAVYVWWTAHVNRSTTVPISVTHAGGTTTMSFNQQGGGGQWVLHGQYMFNAGTAGFVQVTDSEGQAAADAARFVPVSPGEVVIDNAQAGTSSTGTWCVSTATNFFGTGSLYSCGSGTDTYRWTPSLPATASYEVYVWWSAHPNRSTNVPIAVAHRDGTTVRTFNEQAGGGQWVLHGQYTFEAGSSGFVQVSDVNGQAAADAVRWVPVP